MRCSLSLGLQTKASILGSRAFLNIITLTFVVGLCFDICAAKPQTLTNGNVTATFGPRGLSAVTDCKFNDVVHLGSDEFSIAIDGIHLRSAELTPKIEPNPSSAITYAYESQGYVVNVVYRLLPDWKFVSKELQVVKAPINSYVVHTVEPFHLSIGEPIVSVFTPGTYLPHLGIDQEVPEVFPTKKFGEFLRFHQNQGLMLVVQNPFLEISNEGQTISVSYQPATHWNSAWGPFKSDIACIGMYRLSGHRIPQKMVQ